MALLDRGSGWTSDRSVSRFDGWVVYRSVMGLIARVWRTGIDETRADDYDTFAAEISLPMFRRQPGFMGVLFTRTQAGRAVITFWRDQAAVLALEGCEDYRSTVAAISATGFLRSPQSVEFFQVDNMWLADEL